MQRLVGPAAVRYLVENAASMLQIHLDAFCQLLRIPADHHGRYVWDPCDFGFQVTRKRNHFRNFDDVEEIGIPTRVFESEFGPLIDQAGKRVHPLCSITQNTGNAAIWYVDTLPTACAGVELCFLEWSNQLWQGLPFGSEQDTTPQMGANCTSPLPEGLVPFLAAM